MQDGKGFVGAGTHTATVSWRTASVRGLPRVKSVRGVIIANLCKLSPGPVSHDNNVTYRLTYQRRAWTGITWSRPTPRSDELRFTRLSCSELQRYRMQHKHATGENWTSPDGNPGQTPDAVSGRLQRAGQNAPAPTPRSRNLRKLPEHWTFMMYECKVIYIWITAKHGF